MSYTFEDVEADVDPTGRLKDILDDVSRRVGNNKRLPMPSRTIHSVRLITDAPSRAPASARTYRVTNILNTTRPDARLSDSERVYMWRNKFRILKMRSPEVEIPDSNDPDALERMYKEAIRLDHYASSTGTWMIYLSIGYTVAQWVLGKLGVPNIDSYAVHQIEVMKHYPHLIKELGEPGGPSLGSDWPPWLKLTAIIVLHSIVYIIISGITKDSGKAHSMQKIICSTGMFQATAQPTVETEIAGDSAMSNLGSVFTSILGGGALGNIMNMFTEANPMDEIDLENPPSPDVDTQSSDGLPSTRTNPFLSNG